MDSQPRRGQELHGYRPSTRGDDAEAPGPDPVNGALAAIERRAWEHLKPLLHPYLHWTTKDGQVLRGRKRVMAKLIDAPPSGPPSSCEIRDGQIYRWIDGPA